MTNRRRKGKRHRPFVPVATTLFLQPAPQEQQDAILGRARSALHMLATFPQTGAEEFRDLSDVVNTVETLALETGNLTAAEVMPTVEAATTALAQAAERWHAGQRMGLSGPGLQAVREVVEIYADCFEGLTGMEMAKARLLTEQRLHRIKRGLPPGNGRKVVMA